MLKFLKKYAFLLIILLAAILIPITFFYYPSFLIISLVTTITLIASLAIYQIASNLWHRIMQNNNEHHQASDHNKEPSLTRHLFTEPNSTKSYQTSNNINLNNNPKAHKNLDDIIENLIQSPISLDKYVNPVIASDLRFYSSEEYFTHLTREGRSPITERFSGAPFPLSFNKLNTICAGANTLTAIIDLATCPVTKKIMQDPKIAHLIYTDLSGEQYPFVIVCDKQALDNCPPSITLVKKIDWDKLKEVVSHPQLKPRLESALPSVSAVRPNYELMWENAYTQSQQDFPSARPAGVERGAAAQAVYRGAFFQDEPRARRRDPEPPTPTGGG